MSLIWKKQTFKNKWENIFLHLKQEIQRAEITSVIKDHRKTSWQGIRENELLEYSKKWTKKGLLMRLVRRSGNYDGFSHYHPEPKKDGSDLIQVVLSKDKKYLDEFENAFFEGDSKTQGELLGFPACCIDFFQEQWPLKNHDPVVEAFNNSGKNHSPYSNSLLRYIGLRIGFHIPCSFDCRKTIELGKDRLTLLNKFDAKILIEILSINLIANRKNGIMIIDNPYFKIVTGSNIRDKEENIYFSGNGDIFER